MFFTNIHELNIYSLLPAYQGPVLMRHGQDDPTVPVADSEKAAKLYRQATLHVFPHEGHGFSPSGAEQVYELLAQFVRRHCGG